MRKIRKTQSIIFNKFVLRYYNYLFLNYMNDLLNHYNSEYEDDIIIPGRVEISIDGITSYIDITQDTLKILYNLIKIRTDCLEQKFEEMGENEYVDLYQYERN